MKTANFFRAGIVIVMLATMWLSCSKEASVNNNAVTGDTVRMKNSVFLPDSLRVGLGLSVTWYNDDNVVHSVTEDHGLFDSGDMAPGSYFHYTFNAVGIYDYHCTHQSGMTGVVLVASR